jgi:predicted metal-dependent hydrolase
LRRPNWLLGPRSVKNGVDLINAAEFRPAGLTGSANETRAASDPLEIKTDIKIVRSARRKRTVTARWANGAMEVLAPASMPEDQLQAMVEKLRQRLENRRTGRQLNSDAALRQRADDLNRKYFKGRLKIACIEYVANQNRRFGSCTPLDAHIRLSVRVGALPDWVRDYVIVHELAHLMEANHSDRFWRLAGAYPLAERARGYLLAIGMEADGDEAEPGVEGE